MYLGIEIGGTKLQLGLGPGDGTLRALWRGRVDVARGGEGIREQIVREVPGLLEHAGVAPTQVRGVGVGFGGPVDDADQTVIKSHQIEGWDNFPLANWLTELLGWPVALGNDADVAGLAEALFGAGKGLSPIFYITIGSGIGGGLIINGEIYRGCGRGAAEIGHLREFVEDELAGERLRYDLVEHLASGWAIERRARDFAASKRANLQGMWLQRGKDFTTRDVAEAARHGDRVAQSLLEFALLHLAEAIGQVMALLCPRRIVIGGGVSLIGEQEFFEPLRRLVCDRVFKPFAQSYEIIPAALGEEVVIHGALALARKRFGG
jgi:glucokinase